MIYFKHAVSIYILLNTFFAEHCKFFIIIHCSHLPSFRPNDLNKAFVLPNSHGAFNVSSEETIRLAASFDMGWPTKGSGRNYDSLSGTAGLVGYFSKKILSQVVLNRKCRNCNQVKPKTHNNCDSILLVARRLWSLKQL